MAGESYSPWQAMNLLILTLRFCSFFFVFLRYGEEHMMWEQWDVGLYACTL